MPDPSSIYIPEEFESERLLLRTPRPGDGAVVNAAVRESFNELNRWLPWADHVPEIEETEAFQCAAYEKYKEKTYFAFLLFLKSTGEFIGASSLHNVDWSVPQFDIGYWVRSSCTGRGYITEAVNAISGR